MQPLLDRALRQHAGPPGLRADEDRDRVQRRVARDADGRLDLGEAARGRLGGVGREQGRVLLQVRHVRLVRGRAPCAQLLQREHQLDRIEHRDHAREPRRRQPSREPHELCARNVDVDEHARDLGVAERGRLARDVEVEPVPHDEVVERIPVLFAAAVELDDAALLDHERRLRVVRAVHRDEAELRERLDQQLAAELALLACDEAVRPAVSRQRGHAPRTPAPPRGRRRRSPGVVPAVELLRPCLELRRGRAPRPERGVDREDRLVRQRRELRGAQQVVGELGSSRRAGDLGLETQCLGRRP